MLLQLPNLRLLLSSATKPSFPLRSRTFFSVSAASGRRPRDPAPRRISPQRRRRSGPATEEKMEFNRKRAEGRDGGGKRNLQLKARKLNPVNTICYVQILGTGMDTQDTSPSVLLFFDKQRIIFNAGEGLQRFCTEHKIKLSKVDHMLLTRVCSETAGGLPGLLLTLAGIGDEGMSINVWGPSDLKYLVDAMRSFIPNAAMVHTHSFGEITSSDIAITSNHDLPKSLDPLVLVDDEVVRISAILLHPRYSGISMGSTFSLKPGDIAVIYVCELSEIKGKFDPAKASALGLRPGPKYRELQLGNSVASDDQSTMIHPSDVLGPSIPGPIVLLVDCPTPSHLLELLSFQSLNCYYEKSDNNSESGTKSVNCIIHLSPASVTNDTDYQNWMKRFGDVQHIMAGHERNNTQPPVLSSSGRITTRLNHVCPHLFPSPGFCSPWQIKNSEGLGSSREDPPSVHCRIIPAENLLKFQLRPYSQLGLDRSSIPSLKTPVDIVSELLAEIPEIEDASEAVCKLWHERAKGMGSASDEHMIITEEPWMLENASTANLENESDVPCCLENISREDMEIILLGTGSSQPSKYRNVSSIYINLFSKGSVLLDCGEGTLGQLKRRFGVDGADEALRTLRLIWISHIHADHHTGLARILALRNELLKDVRHDPIIVVGPRPLKRFLDAYSRLEDLDMEFLDCRHTTEVSWNSVMDLIRSSESDSSEGLDVKDTESMTQKKARRSLGDIISTKCSQMQSFWKQQGTPIDTAVVLPILIRLQKVLNAAGLADLYSVPVVHCPQAFGVVLKASERMNCVGKKIPGWKLVYSGDTRPCQALVDATRDATVLIHEATFEDGLEAEALAKNHSTTKEAVKVGTSADAYRIILTHFSQRYPKIPVFDETHMSSTCIAFDMMSINLVDLPILPKVLPYLKLLFRNEMTLDDGDEAPAIAVQQ